MFTKRSSVFFIAGLGATFALTGCSDTGGSDGEYPNNNVTMLVPYDAGGNADAQARIVSKCFEDAWGVRVLVENQPGSAGTIGTRQVANAEPDGYTLSLNSVSPYVLGPRLVEGAGYKSEDLQSFGFVSSSPVLLLVDGDSPLNSMEDLMEIARERQVVTAAPGADSLQALFVDNLNQQESTQFDVVPTDSTPEIIRGLMAGDYQVGVTATTLDLMPRIESGEVKILARGGSEDYAFFEGVDTFEEAGYPDILPSTEISVPLVGPAGIPDDISSRIETTLQGCLSDDEVIRGLGEPIMAPEFVGSEESMTIFRELGEKIDESAN